MWFVCLSAVQIGLAFFTTTNGGLLNTLKLVEQSSFSTIWIRCNDTICAYLQAQAITQGRDLEGGISGALSDNRVLDEFVFALADHVRIRTSWTGRYQSDVLVFLYVCEEKGRRCDHEPNFSSL